MSYPHSYPVQYDEYDCCQCNSCNDCSFDCNPDDGIWEIINKITREITELNNMQIIVYENEYESLKTVLEDKYNEFITILSDAIFLLETINREYQDILLDMVNKANRTSLKTGYYNNQYSRQLYMELITYEEE